ncbi:MAG: hypothetical protein HYV07_19360 [Deltaproteobacteria bacterium]|nr:hypothetical protein [Deltaproteobacteria bacterium]
MTIVNAAARIRVRYLDVAGDDRTLALPTDGLRPLRIQGRVHSPALFRDGLISIADVVSSDLRRKASDRSDYLAYVLAKGGKVTQALWDAQKAFLERAYGEDRAEESPLGPIVTAAPDRLSVEAFSRDESAYARLDLEVPGAVAASELTIGTTSLSLSSGLLDRLRRLRNYRTLDLDVSPLEAGTDREILVPYRWLRAFAEVQAAATLPAAELELAPIDLYNVLLALRRRKAKKPPRALRFELVPGEKPRLVLEPWDQVIETNGQAYAGPRPLVVRTFGRNRLQLLAKLLPHARSVRVLAAGPGLPVSYVLDAGAATFTLSLSGWTDAGWAGIATFDLLTTTSRDELLRQRALKALSPSGRSLADLAAELGRSSNELRGCLLELIQAGEIYFCLKTRTFRPRRLVGEPIDVEKLRYRDSTEEKAHRLLELEGQVQVAKLHDRGAEGVSIEGKVEDRALHRVYEPSFVLDREGRTTSASCGCPKIRRAALREGPCEHMIALRIRHSRDQVEKEKARATPEGQRSVQAETRTFVRRVAGRAETHRISLDGRTLLVREERPGSSPRYVRIFFRKSEEARVEYFQRLDSLGDDGFIDASAAEVG